MKALVISILFLGLAACASDTRRAGEITWPKDPAERQVAERYLTKAEGGIPGEAPPQLDFSYRNIDGKLIADHFDYRLDRLEAEEIIASFRQNIIGNYVDELRARACEDPDARYLLDKGFDYEFLVTLKGGKSDKTAREKMNKGFCVANELPLLDREAVMGRHNMIRYWPNGERVDGRLLEQLTGAFQLIASRPERPEMTNPSLEVTNVMADGLMLSIYLRQELENDIERSKYWQQGAKGNLLTQSCTKRQQLISMTIGAIYFYQLEIMFEDGIIDVARYTISYPDCLRYNRK
ncbi:hypothetical protein [uncultured Sneathiella sp.]|jgi:hypothetical protein|uniref:hypothetical protein n=1 Tax=uncultured Sneathiella sp. TaxID=879315 RepID=UPI0030DB5276|tara:strand:- start:771 stop:1649 length:879 start_codon:yes stop_codon:yes gene_type:complete